MDAVARLGPHDLVEPSGRPLVLVRARSNARLAVVLRSDFSAHDPSTSRSLAPWLDLARRLENLELPGVLTQRAVFLATRGPLRAQCVAHDPFAGWSLADLAATARRRHEHVPLPVAVALTASVLRTLGDLHRVPDPTGRRPWLLHPALRPSSILLDASGQTRLWGLAGRMIWEEASPVPADSPEFRRELTRAAPEQLRRQEMGPPGDLYRATSVLWELVTGRRCIEAPDTIGIMSQILYAAPLPPSRHRPDVPPALDAAVRRGLMRFPHERPASAQALAELLTAAVPPASDAEVGAWASSLGAPPWPGPEASVLIAPPAPRDSSPEPIEPPPVRGRPYR